MSGLSLTRVMHLAASRDPDEDTRSPAASGQSKGIERRDSKINGNVETIRTQPTAQAKPV
ncbi:hypothetical protein BN2476_1150062 [Paraburkholderia piptadeniae]|uniref:Uncharacterized protein n=1 Tax=Paraburkholderia piptadeniae TaxID=1701573 RepID=A0A1N7SV51_9BURK|nr:hypothetical protein BN2476_1150062 [Paraburkholderia piptadeniae]